MHATRSTLTWLDADRYAWSVFAGAPAHWYDDPARLARAVAQAQEVLRSDVIGVRLLGPFTGGPIVAGGSIPQGASAGAVVPADPAEVIAQVCGALAGEHQRAVLSETVDALSHHVGAKADLVLMCESPRQLLMSAGAGNPDFDALDVVAAALVDVIRHIADRPLRGLVLSCDAADGPGHDEVDAWSSLLAAARHYGWVTAVRLDTMADPAQLPVALPGDLVLLPAVLPGDVPAGRRYGGGMPAVAWTDSADAARMCQAAARRKFRFGEIPCDAAPETVLKRLAALGGSGR